MNNLKDFHSPRHGSACVYLNPFNINDIDFVNLRTGQMPAAPLPITPANVNIDIGKEEKTEQAIHEEKYPDPQ